MPRRDTNEPWEQQPGESAASFAQFVQYRDQGAERSIRRLARLLHHSVTAVGQLSSRQNWVERAQAYDRSVDRERQRTQQTAIRAMNERHARAAQLMFTRFQEVIVGLSVKDLTVKNVLDYWETLQRIELRARGMPTEVIDLDVEQDGVPIDDPEVQALTTSLLRRLSLGADGAGLPGGPE